MNFKTFIENINYKYNITNNFFLNNNDTSHECIIITKDNYMILGERSTSFYFSYLLYNYKYDDIKILKKIINFLYPEELYTLYVFLKKKHFISDKDIELIDLKIKKKYINKIYLNILKKKNCYIFKNNDFIDILIKTLLKNNKINKHIILIGGNKKNNETVLNTINREFLEEINFSLFKNNNYIFYDNEFVSIKEKKTKPLFLIEKYDKILNKYFYSQLYILYLDCFYETILNNFYFNKNKKKEISMIIAYPLNINTTFNKYNIDIIKQIIDKYNSLLIYNNFL